mmetsp:Transcript_18411/g.42336  ORF Transcript_18411/g.42336 Transcript_18411/m.42336 type:complete len:573 (-) Transcript_18411:6-1724(-)
MLLGATTIATIFVLSISKCCAFTGQSLSRRENDPGVDSGPVEQITGIETESCLLWLSPYRLRVQDNAALQRSKELGPDGLTICTLWPHHLDLSIEMPPVCAFGLMALASLNSTLAGMGQQIYVIPCRVQPEDMVSVMKSTIEKIRPRNIVVDTSTIEKHLRVAHRLRDDLEKDPGDTPNVVEVFDDGLLFPNEMIEEALGRSRQGGRVLRWATFLGNAINSTIDHQIGETNGVYSLPPPLACERPIATANLPTANDLPLWTRTLLDQWGEVSEEEAIRRATATISTGKDPVDSTSPLTEQGSKDTKLSPYLKFGLLSPRRASKLGVRRRDLLWRDWSHVAYSIVNPLQRGDAVLGHMDHSCNKSDLDDLNEEEKERYYRWCVGKTGSKLVDAGMRQLWATGWMPRRIRLLSAACLTEGMNINWSLGRKWFQHTLVDHDRAINEVMWQNAGLVGIDPFYAALPWESPPSCESDEEYVKHWLTQQLAWPSYLKKYVELTTPLQEEVSSLAISSRLRLKQRGSYKHARTVSVSGVRVAWPGLKNVSGIKTGEVIGVGTTSISELQQLQQQQPPEL